MATQCLSHRGVERRPERPRTPKTTRLDSISGPNVLFVLDVENLHIGKLRLDWQGLRANALTACPGATLRAIMTSHHHDRTAADLRTAGYCVLAIPKVLPGRGRSSLTTNSDPYLLADLERTLHGRPGFYDAVVLGTGDLHLATAAAEIVIRLAPQARVYTLSRAASTSPRIAELPWLFNGNFFLGHDLLRATDPQGANVRRIPAQSSLPSAPAQCCPAIHQVSTVRTAPSGWARFVAWVRGVLQ